MKVTDGQKANQGAKSGDAKKGRAKSDRGDDGDKRKFADLLKKRDARAEGRQRRLADGKSRQAARQEEPRHLGKEATGEARAKDGDGEGDLVGLVQEEDAHRERMDDEAGWRAGSGGEFGAMADRNDAPAMVAGAASVSSSKTSAAMGASASPAIAQIVNQVVKAARLGEDGRARQVLFLEVTVPGRGDVRIRVRRDGRGVELRMRADNDALARSLQQGASQLREQGAQQGVEFTSIQVAR